jgi:hypothetical protein
VMDTTAIVGSDGALSAGGQSQLDAAITEAWQRIKEVADDSFRLGWEATKSKVTQLTDYLSDTAELLGNRAQTFRDRLLESIRAVIRETFTIILGSLNSEVTIGTATYSLQSVALEQKVVFLGSLEVSIQTLCKYVGSGELVVKGSYSLIGVPNKSD